MKHNIKITLILLLMFVVMGLLWELIQKPTRGRILLTALAAVLAVQAVYLNAFMLLASGVGAAAVCLRRRQWKTLGIILGISVFSRLPVPRWAPGFLHWNGPTLGRHGRGGGHRPPECQKGHRLHRR